MSTVLILGGSGKVAKRLTAKLVASKPNHTVHSVIRNPAQASALTDLGATPHVHSLEEATVDSLTQLFRSVAPSAIVWCAGAGGGDPSRTDAVDRAAAIKAMDAAAAASVQRYVVVSALDMRDREGKPVPSWYNDDDRARSDKLWNALGAYMRAKLAADKELVEGNDRRGLKWTIIRPGSLSDDDGVGTVSAGRVHLGTPISRADVADAVVEVLQNDGTVGMAFDLLGGNTPIKQAIETVVKEKLDCFEGFH